MASLVHPNGVERVQDVAAFKALAYLAFSGLAQMDALQTPRGLKVLYVEQVPCRVRPHR